MGGYVEMWSRIEVVAQHLVDEAQEGPEWPLLCLEHMFASVRMGPDGNGGAQRKLQGPLSRSDP
jgi:hypothetical protein